MEAGAGKLGNSMKSSERAAMDSDSTQTDAEAAAKDESRSGAGMVRFGAAEVMGTREVAEVSRIFKFLVFLKVHVMTMSRPCLFVCVCVYMSVCVCV